MREMLEEFANLAAVLFGPRWQKRTDEELNRIARPLAEMIGRNTAVKRALKKVSAPARLGGAVGAYFLARTIGDSGFFTPPKNVPPAPVARGPEPPAASPRPPGPLPTAAPPAAPAAGSPAPAMDPVTAQRMIDELFAEVPR